MKEKTIVFGVYNLVFSVFLLIGCGATTSTQSLRPLYTVDYPKGMPIDSLVVTPEYQSYTIDENGKAQYLIGSGDVIQITMREIMLAGDKVDIFIEEVTVRPDGNISFNMADNVLANGQTATQLDDNLTTALKVFYRNPMLDVEVKEFNNKTVSLLGALQPLNLLDQKTGQGRYPLKGKLTIVDLVLTAGGTTPSALLNRVKLIREGQSYHIDMAEIFNTGNQHYNVILQDKDVVIVPGSNRLSKKVAVLGEVRNSNVYHFAEGTTLLDGLSSAGGIKDSALREDIRIIRDIDGKPIMFSADFNRIVHDGELDQNMQLENNDIVFVPRNFMGDINQVIATINPLLDLLLLPASYRELYTTGGGLRVDTGEDAATETIFTRPLPGTAGKVVADPEADSKKAKTSETQGE